MEFLPDSLGLPGNSGLREGRARQSHGSLTLSGGCRGVWGGDGALARRDVQCVVPWLVSGSHRNVILLPLLLSPWGKSSCPQLSLSVSVASSVGGQTAFSSLLRAPVELEAWEQQDPDPVAQGDWPSSSSPWAGAILLRFVSKNNAGASPAAQKPLCALGTKMWKNHSSPKKGNLCCPREGPGETSECYCSRLRPVC